MRDAQVREQLAGRQMGLVHMQKLDNKPESAWQVIDHILKRYVMDGGDGVALDMLEQLVRNNWRLEETVVGKELDAWARSLRRDSLNKKRSMMYRLFRKIFNLR